MKETIEDCWMGFLDETPLIGTIKHNQRAVWYELRGANNSWTVELMKEKGYSVKPIKISW